MFRLKYALLLAGGFDQIDLALKLRARGYFIFLIDHELSPAAAPFCDAHICLSTLSVSKVIEFAKINRIELVATAFTDQALTTLALTNEALRLKSPISSAQATLLTNKAPMKQRLQGSGLKTAKYQILERILKVLMT